MENLNIYYIYHSCFVVETKNSLLVFDYFKLPDKNLKDDISLHQKINKTRKKVYVFSSHSHSDHFNKEIFNWNNTYQPIDYVLSDDIHLEGSEKNCHLIHEGDTLKLDTLEIRAFSSSDLGVSFLVNVDNIKCFHAGDLNWWYWKDDTKEEEKYMKDLFQGIVETIKGYAIDFAFFPIDPRLEEFCYLGGEYFAKEIHPKFIIPMHFDEGFYVCEEFRKRLIKYDIKGAIISRTNSKIAVEI